MYAQSPVIVINDLASLLRNYQHLHEQLSVQAQTYEDAIEILNQGHEVTSRGS